MAKEKKVTQESTPWAGLEPYLTNLFSQGATAAGQVPREPFAGPFIAGPTGRQSSALDDLFSRVAGIGTGAGEVRQLGLDTASGKYLDPASNPFLQSTIDTALRPVEEKYRFGLAPQLEDAAIGGGAYGGARQNLLKQSLGEAFTREAGGVAGNIAYQNYAAERDRQGQAPGLLSAADALSIAGPTTGLQAGGIEQSWVQQMLDNALRGHQEQVQAPFQGLNEFASLLGLGTGYGTQTQTQPLDVPAMILQGLLGAGSLGLQGFQAGLFGG